MEAINTNIHGWWCPRCGYFEASPLYRYRSILNSDNDRTICPTCGALVCRRDFDYNFDMQIEGFE